MSRDPLVAPPGVGDTPQARAAIAFARQGWPVLPCAPRGKVPLTPRGFHDATTDLDTVTDWWRSEPAANVALVPGRARLANGHTLLVVDCDGPAGLDAAATLGIPSDTARVSTGRPEGGEHRYFSVPPGVAIGNRAPAPGLDVRHSAGYVLVPPSVHPSGAAYRWRSAPVWAPGAVHPLPSELLELLLDTSRTRQHGRDRFEAFRGDHGGAFAGGVAARAADAATWRRLHRYLGKVPAGLADGRKTVGYRLAAALVHDFMLGLDDARAVLAAWNADNTPPLGERMLEQLLRNAARYGRGAGDRWQRRGP